MPAYQAPITDFIDLDDVGTFNDDEFVRFDATSGQFVGALVDLSGYALLGHTHTSISNGSGSVSVGSDGNANVTGRLKPLSLDLPYDPFQEGKSIRWMGETELLGQMHSVGGNQIWLRLLAASSLKIIAPDLFPVLSVIGRTVGFGTESPAASLHFVNSNASIPTLKLQGAASQSDPYILVQDSSGNDKLSVSAAGEILGNNGAGNQYKISPVGGEVALSLNANYNADLAVFNRYGGVGASIAFGGVTPASSLIESRLSDDPIPSLTNSFTQGIAMSLSSQRDSYGVRGGFFSAIVNRTEKGTNNNHAIGVEAVAQSGITSNGLSIAGLFRSGDARTIAVRAVGAENQTAPLFQGINLYGTEKFSVSAAGAVDATSYKINGEDLPIEQDVAGGVAGLNANALPTVLGTHYNPALENWHRSGIKTNKKIAFWGDSTTSNAAILFAVLPNYQATGRALENTTIQIGSAGEYAFGSNGDTLANVLNGDQSARASITNVIAYSPDLVIASFGINDVRLGNTTENQLFALMEEATEQIHAALPDCEIVWRTPLALSSDDPQAYSYVVPSNAAQTYTDLLRNAYDRMKNRYPYVVVLDTQRSISGTTAKALALSPHLIDQLHPNGYAQEQIAREIVALLDRQTGFDAGRAAIARLTNYGADYTFVCPRARR